jgi:ubiquinone/menaquinone biosynthesis C-methylase UbiE
MGLEAENQKTTWNEESSQVFVDYGKYFVPERETQIETICDLIEPADEPFAILELCCGEGLLAEALLKRFPEATVYGYDGSDYMLQQAGQRLKEFGERFQSQVFDLPSQDWRATVPPVRAVVSSLAIHHLDGMQKQTLYRDVYKMLEDGGVFVIADIIQPTNPRATKLAAKAWDEAARQRSLELDGNLKAFEFFKREEWNYFEYPDPIDKPSGLFEQLKWLEQAGFSEVDTYWLKAGHAIYGGRKTN